MSKITFCHDFTSKLHSGDFLNRQLDLKYTDYISGGEAMRTTHHWTITCQFPWFHAIIQRYSRTTLFHCTTIPIVSQNSQWSLTWSTIKSHINTYQPTGFSSIRPSSFWIHNIHFGMAGDFEILHSWCQSSTKRPLHHAVESHLQARIGLIWSFLLTSEF